MTTTTRTALLALWERCQECKPPALIVDKAFRNLQGHRLFNEHADLIAEAAITRWLAIYQPSVRIWAEGSGWIVEIKHHETRKLLVRETTLLDALITAANAALDSK